MNLFTKQKTFSQTQKTNLWLPKVQENKLGGWDQQI